MIKKILEKLGLKKKGIYTGNTFSDFFRNASKKEQVKLYSEVIRRSNIAQRKVIEKYDKMVASGEIKKI